MADGIDPWSRVKIPFARKAARRALRGSMRPASDAEDELVAFILAEVSGVAARNICPTPKVYRIAALHGVRSLWTRGPVGVTRGVDLLAEPDPSDDGRSEIRTLSLAQAQRMHEALHERGRAIFSAHLAGYSAREIAEALGETEAAVSLFLGRIHEHLAHGTVPRVREARTKEPRPPRTCVGCGCALVVPPGLRSPPRRCTECNRLRVNERVRARRARLRADPSAAAGRVAP
jgi:DNA-binding CsgD family transcriptional regulator